jgi:hypothetical protein
VQFGAFCSELSNVSQAAILALNLLTLARR